MLLLQLLVLLVLQQYRSIAATREAARQHVEASPPGHLA